MRRNYLHLGASIQKALDFGLTHGACSNDQAPPASQFDEDRKQIHGSR
jgi:hypothetical protein